MTIAETGSIPSNGMRVLVVDDDPIFLSLVSARLRRTASHVVEAEDGHAAWRLTRDQNFDLAIVDFDMPRFNGIELIQCLRGHPRTRHIPIVMCTSRSDPGAMHAALEAGANSYLPKPINWPLFERHIGNLLHLRAEAQAASDTAHRLEGAIQQRDVLVDAMVRDLRAQLQAMWSHGKQPPESSIAAGAAVTAAAVVLDAFEAAYGDLGNRAATPGSAGSVAMPMLPARPQTASTTETERRAARPGLGSPTAIDGTPPPRPVRRLPLPPRV